MVGFPHMEKPLSLRALDTIASICGLVEDSQPIIVFSLGYRENSSYFAFFMDFFKDDSLKMKVCKSSIHNKEFSK